MRISGRVTSTDGNGRQLRSADAEASRSDGRRMLEAVLELRRIGAAANRQFPGSMSDRP